MDWPRTIRLVYASVSISSVCAIMLQVIIIQTRWNIKRPTKEFSKQKSRARHVTRTCPCMTTSIIIKITRDQHVNTFTLIGSQLVVMVLRAQWPLGTIAQFFSILWRREKKKKKRRQKNKGILLPITYYHRYPSNYGSYRQNCNIIHCGQPTRTSNFSQL